MAPRIITNKTKDGRYRAFFDGDKSGVSRFADTAAEARETFFREVQWRDGKGYDTMINPMTRVLQPVLRKMKRTALKRPLNFAGRIVLGTIAASMIGFILFHDMIVPAAPVKQDNKVFMRNGR